MDNTPQEKMQEERLNHIESVHRNSTVETNLALFEVRLGQEFTCDRQITQDICAVCRCWSPDGSWGVTNAFLVRRSF